MKKINNIMKTHNERNAGRKRKFTTPFELVRVPLPILDKVAELSKPYLTPKKTK